MTQTPFPNVFETIRFVAFSFDTKASNKQLDDLSRDVFADYRQVDSMLKSVVIDPLAKYVSPGFARALGRQLHHLLEDYLELVSLKSVDGLKREQILPVLVPNWFVPNALKALKSTLSNVSGMPSAFLLLGNNQRAVENVLVWVKENIEGWEAFIAGLLKEKKDQLANWSKGKYLPDLQSLNLLLAEGVNHGIERKDCTRLMGLLVLARAIDSLRSIPLGEAAIEEARQQLMGASPIENPFSIIESFQEDAKLQVKPLWSHLGYLSNHLRRTVLKSEGVQQVSRHCLDDFTRGLKDLGEYQGSKNKVAQFEGRWHVFSGDLKGACRHYEQALEAALYRAGNELGDIVSEAFCVAAKANDSVLMRKVKNSQILFKVDLESVNQQLVDKPTKKTEQFVQGWEVKIWAAQFERTFPNSGLFTSTKHYDRDNSAGPILYLTTKEVKPNYSNPNRKIKIGHNAKKTWPQVCWFILQDKLEVVDKLIQKGASMDVESSSGDTPLIMALEKLSLIDDSSMHTALINQKSIQEFYRSLDDRFFNSVILGGNIEKSVNKQTQKKKLTPLIQAVETGRPDIVKAILDLGAEPDLKGCANNQTALTVCINRMSLLDNPDRWVNQQLNQPVTLELLDSIRRCTNGVLGATLDSQKNLLNDQEVLRTTEIMLIAVSQRFAFNASKNNMKRIMEMLLDHGADPNVLAESPIKGFTPTMMAAELDLSEELAIILRHGGDLDQRVQIDDSSGRAHLINSWEIAERCKSKTVLRLMEDIRPYYTTN